MKVELLVKDNEGKLQLKPFESVAEQDEEESSRFGSLPHPLMKPVSVLLKVGPVFRLPRRRFSPLGLRRICFLLLRCQIA